VFVNRVLPNPGAALVRLADRLPRSPGRRQRRHWTGNGRAHIEVRGVHRPENAEAARDVEAELRRLDGVSWAEVHPPAGRMIVAFDADRADVDDLVGVIEAVEEAHGLADECFPPDRPDHPGDVEPLHRQLYAIGADLGGLGLSLVGRLAGVSPLLSGAASVVSLVDATPALRRPLESGLGLAAADLALAVGNAVAQGLAQGPLGLAVDIASRGLLLDELTTRRRLWEQREPTLHGRPSGRRPHPWKTAGRAVPLPDGPVESYSSNAAVGALAGAAVVAAVARDPHLAVAATAAANPKPARLGREAFAARVGRDLARSGVLTMDTDALRRLDRVDTVVLDARVLTAGGMVVGSVWVPPGEEAEAERATLAAHALLSLAGGPGDRPSRAGCGDRSPVIPERGGWAIGPVPRRLPGPMHAAARDLRAPGARLLALWRGGGLFGLAVIEPELDPLAGPLVAAARQAGRIMLAGSAGTAALAHADRTVPGGISTAASVRALQADGATVALISARQHAALAAADVGIGVPGGPVPPWGAHLITGPGLAGACRILQAVPAARATSRRAARFAGYGSAAAAVVALSGPRSGAARRSLLVVNTAALVSLGSGVWSAMTLARRPPPRPADTTPWHALETGAVLDMLASGSDGLADGEAGLRRAERPGDRGQDEPGLIRASAEELANPLTPALATGAGLSAAAGSITDAALIGTFMTANALVSGMQRVSVGRALRRLIDESAVRVRLRRGGREELTTADQLVVGDVIVVQAGDAVPADCRILEESGLEVDESSLTGESQLVDKVVDPTAAANIAERRSMLYAGSAVAAGSGSAVVVGVGGATEIGRAEEVAGGQQRPGGVQTRLGQLTRQTIPLALGAGAAVIGGGLMRGRPLRETLGTGVSLSVAAVPESLPIVATAAQYAAARRLSRRGALVRNPGTIEALGRVDVLCFDKTGTLTRGRIRLHRVWTAGTEQPLTDLQPAGRLALAAGLRATPEHRDGEPMAHATDRAVVKGAKAAGISIELDAESWAPVSELPFEPSRGYHAVLGRTSAGHRLAVKGAPEIVLPLCTQHGRGGRALALDRRARRTIASQADRLARSGYRVLAVAERDGSDVGDLREDHVRRLVFAGLLALTDPARDTAALAIRGLRAARVDVMMLTGDHPSTAEAIAAELGLLNGHRVVTGRELDAATDAEVDKLVQEAAVFARVSPDHKVRIVAALRRSGRVVAVTGDGANDAPAIRLADVGVALGRRGTNAAKQAADIVVTDDRIETIIDAIAEGRAMWSSVRDAIAMLLGGNVGEIAFTVGTGLLPGGSPLNARQLLLVNLFTDMVPSLALAVQAPTAATPDVLLREGPDASLGTALTRDILIRGGLTASAGLVAWLGGRLTGVTRRRASTVALVGIVGAQLGQTLVAGWRSPLVVAASLGSAAALAGVIQTPGVSHFFGCTPLGPVGWGTGLSAAAGASICAPVLSGLAGR
jgi:cation-transporting ATPase I